MEGSATVYGTKPKTTDSLGLNKLNEIDPVQGLAVEFVLTLQLVCAPPSRHGQNRRDVNAFAPLAIGSSVVVGHLARGVTVAVLYNYLLCPGSEPLSERVRVPQGRGLNLEADVQQALFAADGRDEVWSKHRI
ncbi:Aquaporin-1 [Merluccius polli]|uniref:Aquaporin-1 n=1 Tax=Merluccius polli TaxID=89951 RepID=A0AA47N0S5_MERPO|nr:Aquaporin-1 [Merluccius polli]